MGLDLILWRHAEAHMAREGQPDLERALTSKGERQAARMAEWLAQRLAQTTRVIASPALRCQQTVRALDRSYKTLPELGPEQGVDDLLKAARWAQAGDPVLVVGHQPTLGETAARLLTGVSQEWSVKKGAVWWLRQREREGVVQVVLHAVMPPDCV